MEERALRQMESVETQLRELERRRDALDDRQRNLDGELEALSKSKRRQLLELERVAGLSAAQARQILLKEVEDEARRQAGLTLRTDRGGDEAGGRAQGPRDPRGLDAATGGDPGRGDDHQAGAASQRRDEGAGDRARGRNIRALENLTGVDFIIDETPSAVLLSSFDGVRREIARLTLEKLIADGRIHPARCEEAYQQSARGDRGPDRRGRREGPARGADHRRPSRSWCASWAG